MTQRSADGWRQWGCGSERPSGRVFVRFRDGWETPTASSSECWSWRPRRDPSIDIIAYKPEEGGQ